MSSFCPICAGHHDPRLGCADRAGAALEEAGIKRRPAGKKTIETKIKEADRLIVGSALVLLLLIILTMVVTWLTSRQS